MEERHPGLGGANQRRESATIYTRRQECHRARVVAGWIDAGVSQRSREGRRAAGLDDDG